MESTVRLEMLVLEDRVVPSTIRGNTTRPMSRASCVEGAALLVGGAAMGVAGVTGPGAVVAGVAGLGVGFAGGMIFCPRR